MIKKAFDYYYLVLMRGYGSWFVSYTVSSLIGMTLTVNLFTLAISLFRSDIPDSIYFWICILISYIVIMNIIDARYNKKYRAKIVEKYKDESPESRRWGVAKVVIYEILSVVFLILVCAHKWSAT